MRKFIAIVVLLAAFWISFPVQAQSDLRLNSVTVDIWPEYDRPAVLVIYHLFHLPPPSFRSPFTCESLPKRKSLPWPIPTRRKGWLMLRMTGRLQGSWADIDNHFQFG